MNTADLKSLVLSTLIPIYGNAEANAITRIVLEDLFLIHSRSDNQLNDSEVQLAHHVNQQLATKMPVQYVVGTALFWGLPFKVTPDVLIPRQETEELVAWISESIKNYVGPYYNVLDIGLGSGCIGISIKHIYNNINLYGIDIKSKSLEIAVENATNFIGKDQFYFEVMDILDRSSWQGLPAMDCIISNPPYIPIKEKHLVPDHVIQFEPYGALFVSDDNPLIFYDAIADFALAKLQPRGFLFFECNEFNALSVVDLLVEKGFSGVECKQDIAGANRMVCAKRW